MVLGSRILATFKLLLNPGVGTLFTPPNTPVVGVVTRGEPPLGVVVVGMPPTAVVGVVVVLLVQIEQEVMSCN